MANLGGVSATVDEQLEAASWDLEPLVEQRGPEAVEEMLTEARERAEAFSERYRARVAELDEKELVEAMRELADIHDLAGRAGSYAMLSYSLDTSDPARGALLQKGRELGAAIETQLLFFDLEWNLVPQERVDELLEGPELAFAAHHLRTLRRYRPYQLTEPEERVLTETNVTGASAFQRLFTEQTSVLEVPLPDWDEPASLEEGLSRLQDPSRERRAEAAAAVTESLRPGLRTRAFVFNNLLQDKATKDRLRG
jgi:oligoendopeptidase F